MAIEIDLMKPPVRAKVCFRVDGKPMSHQRPRFWKGRVITVPEQRLYQKTVGIIAKKAAAGVFFKGPVSVRTSFYFVRSASRKERLAKGKEAFSKYCVNANDVDNLLKQVLDSLNKVLWDDDRQVVIASCEKLYTDGDVEYSWIEVDEL